MLVLSIPAVPVSRECGSPNSPPRSVRIYSKISEKQLLLSEEKRQQGFLRFTAGMHSIHFSKRGKVQLLEVCEGPVGKDRAVCYLGLVAFARTEHGLALQVNVPGCKKPPVKIVIDGADRQVQFRMAYHDLVRGLPIFNQRGYDHVDFVQFLSAQGDTAAGISKLLTVPSVSSFSIVCIFSGNGAVIYCFRTAIADIRSFIQSVAAFHLVVFTGLVAGRTGSTFDATDNDFTAYICFAAVVAVDAEVFCIIEGTFVIPVRNPVNFDLFGNRSRILAEVLCNILEGDCLIKGIFNVDTVFKSQVLLISRDVLTHKFSIYCCQKWE